MSHYSYLNGSIKVSHITNKEDINTAEMSDEIEEKAGKKKRKDQGKADKEARLEEHDVRRTVTRSCLKENNMKRKNREWSSREAKSFSGQCTQEEADQQRSSCKNERIAGESGSDGSYHLKRRKKKLVEGNSLGSGENEKEKKDRDKLVGHVKLILNDTSDRGFDAVDDEPTETAEETGGVGNHRMQRSSVSRDERKTRNKNKKKKKKKNGTAESIKFSVEVNSDEEIASKANRTVGAGKISNISAGEGTSTVRNIDNANASTTAGTKKKVSFSSNVEVIPSTNWIKRDYQSSRDGLVQGKRYSREEDEMIKQAVFDYIKTWMTPPYSL